MFLLFCTKLVYPEFLNSFDILNCSAATSSWAGIVLKQLLINQSDGSKLGPTKDLDLAAPLHRPKPTIGPRHESIVDLFVPLGAVSLCCPSPARCQSGRRYHGLRQQLGFGCHHARCHLPLEQWTSDAYPNRYGFWPVLGGRDRR